MRRLIAVAALLLPLLACQQKIHRAEPVAAVHARAAPGGFLDGQFDNHEQVWQATTQGTVAPPHVQFSVQPLSAPGWYAWHTQLDVKPALATSWVMRLAVGAEGAAVLTPYRALTAGADAGKSFDARQWVALDACALRGTRRGEVLDLAADVAACATIAPGVGADAALLPLRVKFEGEWLRVRLYADQARGAEAVEDARRVRWFGGWGAVNGAGPDAGADNRDWHMNRTLHIGSEGGRAPLSWRDGAPSGYSLLLERVTYREGNTPVLKLSIVGDTDGQVIAYAWADPGARRIGINLGWIQVGLEAAAGP